MTPPDQIIPDDLTEVFAALQQEYLREAPARLAELSKDLAALRSGEEGAIDSLRQRFHRLAGSGGSYGFPEVTRIAREMEQLLSPGSTPSATDPEGLSQAIASLAEALNAGVRQDLPLEPVGVADQSGFGWRALLVMRESPLSESLSRELGAMGYQVMIRQDNADPFEIRPTERPDLVVIGTDAAVDPLQLARYWTAPTIERPKAVVLADPHDRLDRLRSTAAGVDGLFGSDKLPIHLLEYAQSLARVGAPPAHVVVVEDDPAQTRLLTSWLKRINANVTVCGTAAKAREVLSNVTPDLVLLDIDLPDVDGYAIARLIRQEARLALIPVIFLTAHSSLTDRLIGLRAGGDDFLQKPVDSNHLLQLSLTRVERGRRVRELVHRDGLTGALNHSSLISELEHALAYASRHNEKLCFMMLDLDHFKRINDTWGHLVGDQVLMHVSNVFRKSIRQSDVLGRYGGEEFAVILPNCPINQAVALAERIRTNLAASPIRVSQSDTLGPRVSIGVASYPESGTTATELTAAADRALYQAKAQGRDQVVISTP